ncbi:MAG: hypothetical protein JXB62_21785, partial [Pirellulales bacterium]|nr:hypothetical protein [Pirellulales bacterium]
NPALVTATIVGSELRLAYAADANGTATVTVTATDAQGPASVADAFEVTVRASAVPDIVGRYVFYNHSSFDGNRAAADAQDDLAIAPDKVALMPGQTATFANYTSYSRGLNGIMIDVDGMPDGAQPGVEDFEFRVGNSNNTGDWAAVAATPAITIRRGQGLQGSDRVTIVWADNAIQKQWLQVSMLATPATGLVEPDVFYFGNSVGESGNSSTNANVNATDMLLARNNPRTFLDPAAIDFPYDYNRDQRVSATDMLLARNNQTHFLNALRLITVPGRDDMGGAVAVGEAKVAQEVALQALGAASAQGKEPWDVRCELERWGLEGRPSSSDRPRACAVDLLLATIVGEQDMY